MPGCRSLSEAIATRGGVLVNRESSQAHGLKLWYPGLVTPNFAMASTQDLRLRDCSGRSNDLMQTAFPDVNGIDSMGPYFAFTDGGDFARAQSDSVPMIGSAVTISMWVYLTTHAAFAPLIAKHANSANSADWDWGILMAATPDSGTFYTIRNGANLSPLTTIPTGAWAHVVSTCDDTFCDEYVNGVLANSQGGIGTGATTNTATRYPYVCGAAAAVAVRYADIRVYSRRFTASDVRAAYDPKTRYDLVWRKRRSAVKVPAAGGFSVARSRANAGAGSVGGGGFALSNAGQGVV